MSNFSNEFSIPRRSFRRAVQETTPVDGIKWSDDAMRLLQSVTENEIVDLMMKSSKLASHAKRAGITASDIVLAKSLNNNKKVEVPKSNE